MEGDYECEWGVDGDGANRTQYCAYTRAINFTVVSLNKLAGSNTLSIVIAI